MGFFRSAFRVLGDVTSLGGTARIRHWSDKQGELLNTHRRLCASIDIENGELLRAVAELKKDVRRATTLLRKVGRMLDPLGQGRRALDSASPLKMNSASNAALVGPQVSNDPISKELAITAGGLGLGTGTAVASWGVVQVLAHASTGTAMATLHGAAAASAGWAWFGGGSLAAGGGGMALGHLILPGIGTAVAVTFSSVISHREANKLAEQCAEIEKTNAANRQTLATLESNSAKVRGWESLLKAEYASLNQAARMARKRLFHFGIFTHLWRVIRFWLGGEYYREYEARYINELDVALTRFIEAFTKL